MTSSDGNEVSRALAEATQRVAAGRLEEAEGILRGAQNAHPDNADIAAALAGLARRVGRLDDAASWLERAVALAPDEPAHVGNLGNVYRALGRYDPAIACYRRVLETMPGSAAAHNNLGLALKAKGDLAAAVEAYRRAIDLDPGSAEAHNNLGVALLARDRPDEALPVLRAAVAARPDFAEAGANLGSALRRLGRQEEAIALLRDVVATTPGHGEAHLNLANALHDLGRSPDAIAAYLAASRFDAVGPGAVRQLVSLLEATGRAGDADTLLRQAVERWPGEPALVALRGAVRHRAGREDEARQILLEGLERFPDSLDLLHRLAELYLAQRRWREPLDLYRRILDLEPDNPVAVHIVAAFEGGSASAPLARYVGGVFDDYAETFDRHLVETLGYRAPEILVGQLVEKHVDRDLRTVLDLGCGTGLVGAALKRRFEVGMLVGVDLSSRMLDEAAAKDVYDKLETAEILDYLHRMPGSFDLVTACDVLIYLGDLAPVFAAVRSRLSAGGHFCFTVEDGPGESYALGAAGRYAHARLYVQGLARAHRFHEVAVRADDIRRERGRPVPGSYVLLRAD